MTSSIHSPPNRTLESCMSSLSTLQNILMTLTPIEQKIGTYFLENTLSLVGKPILEVAQNCGTSKSAVVRLCKHLGFTGYKEFQNDLSATLALQLRDQSHGYCDIYPESSVAKICSIVTLNSIQALGNTLRIININALEPIVALVSKAKRLDFYGIGNSLIVAEDADLKFSRIGFNTHCSSNIHRQLIDASTLQSGDVAFFFSYSGTTKNCVDLLEVAMNQKATTVAITCVGGNILSEKADFVLETASTENLVRTGAMTSRLVMLGVVDMVFTAVASKNYHKIKDILDATTAIIEKERI